jgi:RNA polymerase sigma-70 factor, ECF subfamily
MRITDSQLVRRLQANDRAAFEDVVERYYGRVYRQLWHLCGQVETAADLTQETFVQAWKSLPSFQGRSGLRTWLYTIAVRVWQRWKERSSGHEHLLLDELADTLPDPDGDPAALAETHHLQEAVREALQRLPEAYREALVLFYLQGMKYQEIADALGIPLGTVKSRLHGGLQRIKTLLEHVTEHEVIRCD